MNSTLFRLAKPPTLPSEDGPQPDDRYYVVATLLDGTVLLHGQPNAPIPKGATVIEDGSRAWTWGQIAAGRKALAAQLIPHDWLGGGTASDVSEVDYPKIAERRTASVGTTEDSLSR